MHRCSPRRHLCVAELEQPAARRRHGGGASRRGATPPRVALRRSHNKLQHARAEAGTAGRLRRTCDRLEMPSTKQIESRMFDLPEH